MRIPPACAVLQDGCLGANPGTSAGGSLPTLLSTPPAGSCPLLLAEDALALAVGDTTTAPSPCSGEQKQFPVLILSLHPLCLLLELCRLFCCGGIGRCCQPCGGRAGVHGGGWRGREHQVGRGSARRHRADVA